MSKKFKDNFKIKVLSFMFAFVMWIYVMSEVDPIVIRSFESIPVETITNIDEIRDNGLTFAYGQNFNVKIDFRAKRSTLNEYIRSGVKPKGEIYDPKEGVNTMTVEMDTPKEIEYSVLPEYIEVTLEKSVVTPKDVIMETEGSVSKDFVVGSLKSNKTRLYIEGPKSQVEKVDSLLAKVKLENQNKSFSTKINLIPVDSKAHVVEGVTVRDANVIIDVGVEKVKTVPVELKFVDSKNNIVKNNSFEPETKTIEIQGPESIVDKIDSVKTKPIDIKSFNSIDGISYQLEPIDKVKFLEDKVKVIPIESEVAEYALSISKEDIEFSGILLTEEIKNALPDNIDVKIYAGKEYQDKINKENVKIVINNISKQASYKLNYKIEFPIESIKVTPDVINLN